MSMRVSLVLWKYGCINDFVLKLCPEGLFINIFPRLLYDLVDSWFKFQLSDKAL